MFNTSIFSTFGVFLLDGIQFFILLYFLLLNGIYCVLLYFAIKYSYQHYQESELEDLSQLIQSDSLPLITFIVPAYNEAQTIEGSIRTLLQLSYRYKQLIVVNDGSSDLTLDILKHRFSLMKIPPFFIYDIKCAPIHSYYQSHEYPNLLVIDKLNAGSKADALNAGINACMSSIVVTMDSDTLIVDSEFNSLIRPFLMDSNTIMSGAILRVVNDCKIGTNQIKKVVFPTDILSGMQCLEYLRAFYFGRMGWNWARGNLIVSGAFGMFKTEPIVQAGGYDPHSLAEDMEMTVHVHYLEHLANRDYKVAFLPNPVAWTEVPEDWRSLAHQRERWHRGLIQTLKRYREMCFNPRFGWEGMVTFPFYVFGEMFAPLIELTGYVILIISYFFGFMNWQFFWLFLGMAWGLMTLFSISSILIEELTFRRYSSLRNIAQMVVFAMLENFGYRQMTVWWRVKAFFHPEPGERKWVAIKRIGFEKEEA